MLSRNCDRGEITFDQIKDMFRLMTEHNGLGLAAPQAGINARVFVTAWGQVFYDPQFRLRTHLCWSEEGCLSIPGVTIKVPRWRHVLLESGEWFHDLKAFVIQHEYDHLNGQLISHRYAWSAGCLAESSR